MKKLDISNFRQILTEERVCRSLDSEDQTIWSEKTQKLYTSLILELPEEKSYKYFTVINFCESKWSVDFPGTQPKRGWLREGAEESSGFLNLWSTFVTPKTNIIELQNELIEKNKLIVNLAKTQTSTVRLLNKLSVGILFLFLLTIVVCYFVFS